MWEVDVELVRDWLDGLDANTYAQVVAALEILQEVGPQLGRPLVDTIQGSRHANMKELRPGSSGRTEIRLLFAFDPKRQGIVLIAGDKAGNWRRWYKTNIPLADKRYDEHLEKLEKEKTDDKH